VAYQRPGARITEVPVNQTTAPVTISQRVGIIANGSRVKGLTEELIRGAVSDETLTVAGSAPYTAVLSQRARRSLDSITIYRDDVPIADRYMTIDRAYIQGTVTAAVDFTTINDIDGSAASRAAFGLHMDGLTDVTIWLVYDAAETGATPTVTISGSVIRAAWDFNAGSAASIAMADIVIAINSALAAAGSLGYGAAYSAVCTVNGTGLRILSPSSVSGANSYVELIQPVAEDARALLFGVAGDDNRTARTRITLNALAYSASAVYTADYLSLTLATDSLEEAATLQTLSLVGSAPGASNYEIGTDFAHSSGTLNWDTAHVAAVYSVPANTTVLAPTAGTDTVQLSLDGRALVDLDLIDAGASVATILGWTAAIALPLAVGRRINALLSRSVTYGPRYRAVAVGSGAVGTDATYTFTSPTVGRASQIIIGTADVGDARDRLFDLGTAAAAATGTGREPAIGASYYVNYLITRPSTDYNVLREFFDSAEALADLGPAAADNPLALAVSIVFQSGNNAVSVVQVNDAINPGSPLRAEFAAALEASLAVDQITELCVISTDSEVQSDIKEHIERANTGSLPETQRWRVAWLGMPAGTPIGNRDTAGTFIYTAARVFSFSNASPGRGCVRLVAPPKQAGVEIDIVDSEARSVSTLTVDSTYLAVRWAAERVRIDNPGVSMARRTAGGVFKESTITTANKWRDAEVDQLAANGVFVTQFKGNLFVLDPCTTERAGADAPNYALESMASQKHAVNRVMLAAQETLYGVTAESLVEYLLLVRDTVASVLTAEIGRTHIAPYYTGTPGTSAIRPIDKNRDIVVKPTPGDVNAVDVEYWFNTRNPILRINNRFSVNAPFFTL